MLLRSATVTSRYSPVSEGTVTFRLPGFDEPQPAGDYRVDHDEEAIEGISRLA